MAWAMSKSAPREREQDHQADQPRGAAHQVVDLLGEAEPIEQLGRLGLVGVRGRGGQYGFRLAPRDCLVAGLEVLPRQLDPSGLFRAVSALRHAVDIAGNVETR